MSHSAIYISSITNVEIYLATHCELCSKRFLKMNCCQRNVERSETFLSGKRRYDDINIRNVIRYFCKNKDSHLKTIREETGWENWLESSTIKISSILVYCESIKFYANRIGLNQCYCSSTYKERLINLHMVP